MYPFSRYWIWPCVRNPHLPPERSQHPFFDGLSDDHHSPGKDQWIREVAEWCISHFRFSSFQVFPGYVWRKPKVVVPEFWTAKKWSQSPGWHSFIGSVSVGSWSADKPVFTEANHWNKINLNIRCYCTALYSCFLCMWTAKITEFAFNLSCIIVD